MSIKLVAIDLYGTLVGPGGKGIIPEKNRHALKMALDRGIKIALVTGTNRAAAMYVLETSEIPAWHGLMVACYNGAVMFEPASGKVIWELSLPPELGASLVKHPMMAPYYPMVHGPFDSNDLMWIQKGDYSELLTKYLKRRVETLGAASLRTVNKLADSVIFPSQDICILAPEDKVRHTAEKLENQFGSQVKLVRSLWRDGYAWLEILPPGSGKGNVVARMCQHFGIHRDQVMAIGDNWNDIEMFEQSGVSVAMGNALDEVKQRASFVTLSWDQSGVAHAFKSRGLTE